MTTFPFRLNWRDPIKVSYEFKTDIFTTRSRREQRRALRMRPRMTVEGTSEPLSAVTDSPFLAALLTDAPYNRLFPDFRFRAVPGETPAWLTDDADVAVVDDSGEVTFTTGAAVPGDARFIYPVLPGFMDRLDQDLHTATVSELPFSFSVSPGFDVVEAGSPALTLDDREVFTFRPNHAGVIGVRFDGARDEVDFGFGVTSAEFPQPEVPRSLSTLDFIEDEGSLALLQFFVRHKGRAREFFAPSFQVDLTLASPLVVGESTMEIEQDGMADTLTDHPVIRFICSTGDQWLMRKIVSVEGSTITVDAPWEAGDTATSFSFLMLHRFVSDTLVVEHVTRDVTRLRLGMQSLRYHPVDQLTGGFSVYDWFEKNPAMVDILDVGVNQTLPAIVESL